MRTTLHYSLQRRFSPSLRYLVFHLFSYLLKIHNPNYKIRKTKLEIISSNKIPPLLCVTFSYAISVSSDLLFYQIFGCSKANFGVLRRWQPYSPDVNHSTVSSLTGRSRGASQRGSVPKPGPAHHWDLNWKLSDFECNAVSH